MLNSLKQTSKDFLRLLLETANMRGPQWPDNFGSVSWRWLCRLKWASSEKAGIFAFAFQRVAVPQTCRLWIWLFCLPGFLRRGRTRVMRLSVLTAMLGA